ncbi:hypothetical protein [Alkalicoccobacillus murimartini]|uniref:Minor capsid protein n=1 Tax=Alkalicoccobacillus murimartini TaxID=171685 RepID=A0ABT9YI07_9BACI|nr:hypothetical protein [Alkalicoccobacillus murimartini]MDQ0206669.1 hypothetical protein [Alkalicoccobacillus murimartini]
MNIDFLDRLVLDLLNKQSYYSLIVTTPLVSGNGITLKKKSSDTQASYYDGSHDKKLVFEVITKHEHQLEAYNTLLKITNDLTQIKDVPSANNTYLFNGINVKTNPDQYGKDETYYYYSAAFSADLYIKERF